MAGMTSEDGLWDNLLNQGVSLSVNKFYNL